MIKPVELTNTQILSLGYGISNSTNSSNPNPSDENQDLSDDVLDSIQQNYEKKSIFLDNGIWQNNLLGERLRPYFDVSIHPYANGVRLPVVSHDYDVYADSGLFYEGLTVNGDVNIGGSLTGNVTYDRSIETIHTNKFISLADRSKIINSEPENNFANIILPASGIPNGFFFELVNCLDGKYTRIELEQGELKAKGSGLSQKYSACHVYRHNDSWYAIGDLTA